ncbi:MAG: hypothetical protein KDD70_11460 [Bdellovibrionales bacterium]|nr:hypothetical protein [Bdellovibrionales bacterium]
MNFLTAPKIGVKKTQAVFWGGQPNHMLQLNDVVYKANQPQQILIQTPEERVNALHRERGTLNTREWPSSSDR